jgi:predicted TIM-barrel fold metal-dependent hydrolase
MRALSLCLLAAVGALPSARAAADTPPAFADLLKIDAHSHVFEDVPAFHARFRQLNVRTVNVCVRGATPQFAAMHATALALYRREPELYPFVATFDLTRRDRPDYASTVNAWLDDQFRQGAVAVKIWKEVGMEFKRPDGSFQMPDDPVFDPIYAHIAARGKPLLAHLAEPIDAWLPLDANSPHYQYYSTNPEWHLYGKPGFPSHATIIAARDHILAKHPKLIVVGAHLGSLEHDLDGLAQRFDRYPNFFIDCSARTRNLARHPSDKVRAFFLKYSDRILYGVDQTWSPIRSDKPPTDAQRQGHLKRLEERYRNDYLYYAGSGEITYDNRQVQALALPRAALERFYHANAERIYGLAAAWKVRK